MSNNKNLQLWKWAALLLVLCNIALIITVWIRPGLSSVPGPETPRDFVIRSLKFSEDQVKRYDSLISLHKNTMEQLKKESKGYRQQLFGNIKNNGQSGFNPDSLSQLIANNQKQIELATYNHFVQVRAICNDAQKVEFDRVINDIMVKMSGNQPHRDHEGPHRDGDGGPENPHPKDRPGPPENN